MRILLRLFSGLLLAVLLLEHAPIMAAGSNMDLPPLVARVQLHRNALRSSAYVPRWQPDTTPEPARIGMTATTLIPLDGDGLENARGNLYPIDVDGDGIHEFLHFNGFRVMRVHRQDGTKLWELRNPAGRVHRYDERRDTLAVLDADGDGRQEIIHCWSAGRTKLLMLRDGGTGQVLRQLSLPGDLAGEECQIAAFIMAGAKQPVILVARRAPASANCRQNYVDTWSRVTAYAPDLRVLWDRTTCDAGHYAWPLDEDGNGRAEAVFVGKYLLDAGGRLVCTLPGFKNTHVDSMVAADLDPDRPGHEVAVVGATGTRLYSATRCVLRWSLSNAIIRDPQHVNAARTADGPPTLLVRQKRTEPTRTTYHLNAAGQILGSFADDTEYLMRTQIENANVDGAPAAEDRVTRYGQVMNDRGELRLDRFWYWDLQPLTPAEKDLPPTDLWAVTPLVVDLDRNGRDEIVTWGRRLIVVGRGS